MYYKTECSMFVGKETSNILLDFLIEENFYSIVEVENLISKEEIKEKLILVKDDIFRLDKLNLNAINERIDYYFSDLITKNKFSLCIFLNIDGLIYLITRGEGEVLVFRKDKLSKIIRGNTFASGYAKDNDIYILVSGSFKDKFNVYSLEEHLKKLDLKKTIEEIASNLKQKDSDESLAIFIHFKKNNIEEENLISDLADNKKNLLTNFINEFNFYQKNFSNKKKITFIVLLIILIIFIWSVGFGYSRRQASDNIKKIDITNKKIDDYLSEAKNTILFDSLKTSQLIENSKKELEDLKKILNGNNQNEIDKLAEKISVFEKNILKKESKNYEIYYDFSLIRKNIKIDKIIYLDNNSLLAFNKQDGEIYEISIESKAVKTFKNTLFKSATFVGKIDDEILFFNFENGISKLTKDNQIVEVIKKDPSWGSIVEMFIYGKNIYLFDNGLSDIYKYTAIDGGYSDKKTYFADNDGSNFSNANSFSIDGSIYFGYSDSIVKYTSGLRDGFSFSSPDEHFLIDKIFTSKELDYFYLLDKKSNRVLILKKDGKYEKQINSLIFEKAVNFFVSENVHGIFVLFDDKIYKVGLD